MALEKESGTLSRMGLWGANVMTGVFIAIPYVLMGAIFWVVWKKAREADETRRLFLLYPAVVAFLAGAVFGISGHIGILSSHSSTAAVGFFFLPFWMIVVAGMAWVSTMLVLGAVHLALSGRMKKGATGVLGALLALLLLAWGGSAWVRSRAVEQKEISVQAVADARSPFLSGATISRLLGRAKETGDLDILLALITNPAMPAEGTANIYMYANRAPDSDPRKSMVLRALAANPHTPDSYLHALEKDGDPATRAAAIENLQRRGSR